MSRPAVSFRAFVSCLALGLVACTGPGALDAGVEPDGGEAVAPVAITGRVLQSLCEPLEGATVTALETGATATSGADGRFTLELPARASVEVTAPGRVPTLSFERRFAASRPARRCAWARCRKSSRTCCTRWRPSR